VRERLKEMANRFTGPKAVQLRQEPVPWAYRVFFRQVGIDPDERRTPVEAIALERMRAGGFRSRSLLDDAMLIATVETGVPLVAFDADRVGREIGLRLSHPGEYLGGEGGRPLALGQIVVADEDRSLAVLFADLAVERGVTPSTTRIVLAAVQVRGVPRVSVEEALWIASEVLSDPDPGASIGP
jgi:DNA/RNA-binding domain of Phe-tRNA-synthetase-like protein